MSLDENIVSVVQAIGTEIKDVKKPKWVDIVAGGTFIADLGSGVLEYSYNGNTYYRVVVDEPYTDKIYSNIELTNLVSERG